MDIMHESALYAEHTMMTRRMVPGAEIEKSWTGLKRRGWRISPEVLRYLHKTTSGKFSMGNKWIAFEKAEDALMYRIAYPA